MFLLQLLDPSGPAIVKHVPGYVFQKKNTLLAPRAFLAAQQPWRRAALRCSTECGCCNYGSSPSPGSAGWLGCTMNMRPAHACNRCRCRVLNASASSATHNHPHPFPRFGMTALFCLRLLILVIAVATQPYPDSVSGSNGEENSFRVDIDSASFRAVPLHEDKDFSCPSPPIEQICLLLALRLCSRCVSAFFSTFSFLSAQTLARLPAL